MGEKKAGKPSANRQALYRRYRSTSFDELVGQEHVTELLKSAVKNDSFSHAYLFTGQRGTGKTSAARILAYAINELPYDADTGYLDIIEIDAASNRRIDDIRDLREKVFIAPVSAKYKVYIIDEVHMLTGESFNALLKTIEEPPAHAVFILATTELHKVPATIVSRTQRFHFRPVAQSKVVEHLAMIAKKENIEIDTEALKLIAEHGGGSFRDSISLLDQLGSLDGNVTVETVESILGRARSTDIATILQLVREQKQSELHALLTDMLAQGISPVTLSEQLVATLLKQPEASSESYELCEKLMSVPKAHFPQLLLLSTLLGAVAQVEGIRKKEEGRGDLRSQILDLGESQEGTGSEAGAEIERSRDREIEREDAEKRVTLGGDTGASGATTSFSEDSAFPAERGDTNNQLEPSESEEKDGGSGAGSEPSNDKSGKSASNKQGAFDWDKVLAATKKTNPVLHSIISRANVRLDGTTLHCVFKYALHRKKLEQPQYRTQLSHAIQDVCSSTFDIKIEAEGAENETDDKTKQIADLMGGGERVRV